MRKGFPSVWSVLITFSVFSLVLAQNQAASEETSKQTTHRYKKGEVVVKLKTAGRVNDVTSLGDLRHDFFTDLGEEYAVTVKPLKTDGAILHVKVEDPVEMNRLIGDIRAKSGVEYVEPNYIYQKASVERTHHPLGMLPNDPLFKKNWGLFNLGQVAKWNIAGIKGIDIDVTKAWMTGQGSKQIRVAVIDTGVDYNHEDLRPNIMRNPREIPNNGEDDDANGFIDDVVGWDFYENDNDPMDEDGHGTHCAGTIGAVGDNGIGTAGVAWKVSLLPLRFLGPDGGSLIDGIDAINYAISKNVHIMSNSWGSRWYSMLLHEAIKEAEKRGILFVAAAGNSAVNADLMPHYPSNYEADNVISVASTGNNDQLSAFSNWGRKTVHLAAPGTSIFSTGAGEDGPYQTMSGTSMATPHVAGAAALLWSFNTRQSYKEIKAKLLRGVDPVSVLAERTISGGRLNVYNSMKGFVQKRIRLPEGPWKSVPMSLESKHPYDDGVNENFEVRQHGAKFMRLYFKRASLVGGLDALILRDSTGRVYEEISGYFGEYLSVVIPGDEVKINFQTAASGIAPKTPNEFGFILDRYEYIE
ncbi:MAG: S8 family peptidase [Bdellovibrionota bacterium]